QRIAPAAPVQWTALPLADLSALPEPLREAAAHRLAGEEAVRPFDLERGPLLRATVLRLAAEDHAALFTMHHIVSDAWSQGLLVQEVTAFYAGQSLPALPVQYADYAAWQREWLQGETLESQLRFWRERLAGAPPVLELPADRPR